MTYKDKIFRLEIINEKKAVFIGGSGTHFGISAEEFEEKTGIQSVNMGLHASISMKTYLELIYPYVNDGDYIFIIPEYDYYCTPWVKMDSQNVEFSMMYANNYIEFFTSSIHAFPNSVYVGWSKCADDIKQIVSLVFTGHSTEAYLRQDSNIYGDFVNYKKRINFIDNYATFDHLNEDSISQLMGMISRIEKKGAIVFILFPPYADFAFDQNIKIIQNIYGYLSNNRSIRMLFQPYETKFSRDELYDTVYHLNSQGKKRYTQLVINKFQDFE